jgi:dienelactone hydrolase
VTRLAAIAFAFLAAAGASARGAPAAERAVVMVLFHGCHEGASSADWKPLRDALPAGFHAIAPELPKIEAEGDNAAWMAAWRKHGTATIDRAFAEARQASPTAFLVAAGSGCGGFFALLAAQTLEVDAVVTLSGLSDEGQRERLAERRTPVLGVASRDDGTVPARVEEIVRSGGPGSHFDLYPGNAHGTAILEGRPERAKAIVGWVQARIAAGRRREDRIPQPR